MKFPTLKHQPAKMADHSEVNVKISNQISPEESYLGPEEIRKSSEKDAVNDGLEDLLDSALHDFEKPASHEPAASQDVATNQPESETSTSKTQEKSTEPPLLPPDQEAMFNQLFTSGDGATNFESVMSSFMSELGKDFGQDPSTSDDLARLLQGGGGEGFSGFGAVPPSEGAASSGPETLNSTLGATINRLVHSAQELKDGDIPEEEIFRQMENMRLGDGSEGEMMPMMQQMMQSLLSKEILYPSLKEVVEKYPQWLEENETKVEKDDFERYTKQFELMKRLCIEYESERPSDTEDVKQERMTRIMDLIQEMEGLGQPPTDIVGEGGAGLGLQGMPKIPGMPQGDQCSIM